MSPAFAHLDDIVRSKEAAGRDKDRESLPRLKAFREWWISRAAGPAQPGKEKKDGRGQG